MDIENLLTNLEKKLSEGHQHRQEQINDACERMINGCILLCGLDSSQTIQLLSLIIDNTIDESLGNRREMFLHVSKFFLDCSKEYKNDPK